MGRAIPIQQDDAELAEWEAILSADYGHVSRNAAMRGGLRLAVAIIKEDPQILYPYLPTNTFVRGVPKPRKPK